MKILRTHLPHVLICVLLISAGAISYVASGDVRPNTILSVAFLDIGQGDAIYIEAPNGRQMLIDGGAGNRIIEALGEVMPFGDRSIDVVVATHTDADHIGGLPAVLEQYDVGYIIENGGTSNTKIYQALRRAIEDEGSEHAIARQGMKVLLDEEKNISFNIIFPDRDISNMESNDGSIVGKLVYGTHSFMLTGDATKYTELLMLRNEMPETLQSTVLKLGHHGSHTSSTESWLRAVSPEVAIISAGKNNRYGHPHQDVLTRLRALSILYRATYDDGTIIFETDGINMSQK